MSFNSIWMRFAMLFLILTVVVIAIGFVLTKKIDQRRWQRFQFERDMYFRHHPYVLNCNEQFSISLNINKNAQRKLINDLMLKASTESILKKATLQREPEHNHRSVIVKVMIQDLIVAYLDPNYAKPFCRHLTDTDFDVGRPIEVLAEILVFEDQLSHLSCKIKLDLPRDPTKTRDFLLDGSKSDCR